MSIVLRSRKTLAQRYRGVLKKYSTSHLWDFGVPQGPLAYAATHTAAEFLAAYPAWHLYQDTAGTIPACKITDPVGLCLDTGSGGVALGPELVGDWTSGWTQANSGVVIFTVGKLKVTNGANTWGYAYKAISTSAGKTYTLPACYASSTSGQSLLLNIGTTIGGAELSPGTVDTTKPIIFTATGSTSYISFYAGNGASGTYSEFNVISIREVIGAHASQATTTKRPILSGRVNLLSVTTTLSTQSITTLAASYKLTFTGSGTVTLSGTYSGSLVGGGSLTFTATAGTLTLTVTGSATLADLRPANSPTNIPAYQRVTSAADYDTVGFPVRALFDGVDDCLVVPLLDLSMTDKVTFVAGVTKLSDAAVGTLCVTGDGRLTLYGPSYVGGPVYAFRSAGTVFTLPYISGAPAPNSSVVTAQSKISTPIAKISANRVRDGNSIVTTDQGAGNFGSGAFYIAASASNATPFNGAIQSLAVIGNLLPDGEVQILEASANAAMGKVY